MITQEEGLKQIGNLSASDAEFLVAAGVESLPTLAGSNASVLQEEMTGANAILAIDEFVPSISVIESWIEEAKKIGDIEEPERVITLPLEAVEEEIEILAAIPVPASVLIKQNINVRDVAPMEIFLEEELEPESINVEAQDDEPEVRRKIDILEVAPFAVRRSDEESDGSTQIKPLEKSSIRDIRKTPSPELNKGKKLHSRAYIRGVLHPQALRVRFAALVSLIILILLPATFVAGGLMLAKFTLWLAVIPAAFLLFGILYGTHARGLKCRICGQPLFAPKACHRHVKAHRFPFLGYILPTSIHILLFHWFRCMYCGTSVRIKE
ncbi:MAG: DUF4332 domain-containing protein [Akkermansiaceae bacterium]|jgi:hypothetical protein